MTTLSILVPVYNERTTLQPVLESVLAAPLPGGVEREVIVVDDGSDDGSRELLERLAGDHDRMRLISHGRNRGKGAAIRTALARASGDIAVIQDADLEYSPSHYIQLLSPILEGRADVVYGSRFLAAESGEHSYRHSLGNRLLTTLCNTITGLNLTDIETGYKAFRREVLQDVPLRSHSFTIEPELTVKFAQLGCRVTEVPISYQGRSYREGKKIGPLDGFKAVGAILRYGLLRNAGAARRRSAGSRRTKSSES